MGFLASLALRASMGRKVAGTLRVPSAEMREDATDGQSAMLRVVPGARCLRLWLIFNPKINKLGRPEPLSHR